MCELERRKHDNLEQQVLSSDPCPDTGHAPVGHMYKFILDQLLSCKNIKAELFPLTTKTLK
jgi:hypothetical protein